MIGGAWSTVRNPLIWYSVVRPEHELTPRARVSGKQLTYGKWTPLAKGKFGECLPKKRHRTGKTRDGVAGLPSRARVQRLRRASYITAATAPETRAAGSNARCPRGSWGCR